MGGRREGWEGGMGGRGEGWEEGGRDGRKEGGSIGKEWKMKKDGWEIERKERGIGGRDCQEEGGIGVLICSALA